MFRLLVTAVSVLILGSLPAGLLQPSYALASSRRDVVATHKALVAADVALSAVVRTWPTEEASFRTLDQRFQAECSNVGAGSPQSESEQRLSYDVTGALWATAYKTDAKIAETAIAAVSGLRWSNPALTGRVHRYIKGLREMIALPVPDLCADVRAWVASGYRTVPANVVSFDEHVEAIDVEVPEAKLFARFVKPSDRRLLNKVKSLAVRFEELEFTVGQREWNRLLEVLKLNQ